MFTRIATSVALVAAVTVPAVFAATAQAAVSRPAAIGATQGAPTPAAPIAPSSPAPAWHYYGGQTSYNQVAPHGEQGYQTHMHLNAQQKQYALDIVKVAQRRGMPAYAAVIAVATALQESGLKNYTSAVDHDSLGLFQQRPSTGWGTPEQITNPYYAANAFLSALQSNGYRGDTLTEAAQRTQGSAFPDAYAKWQDQAADIVSDISNGKF